MIKTQNFNSKLIVLFISLLLNTGYLMLTTNVRAVSPTASPSAQPTTTEDEKVKEIRDAIKEKVNEIKEKIEKRAYVGTINQITDSTFSVDNFRGKQRVRLTEETTIVGLNKKEIKPKELALEDKVIAMGTLGDNEILEAKRVLVVPKPKSTSAKRVVFFGQITKVESKSSLLTLTDPKNSQMTLTIKVEQATGLYAAKQKTNPKFKDLTEGQKVAVVYPEPAEGKTAIVKTLFLLQ
jgi:hypothetical protein